MPSYMNFVVIALAASNLSTALSVPIQEVREQSLGHRNGDDPQQYGHSGPYPVGEPMKPAPAAEPLMKDPGINWKGKAVDFVVGTAATITGLGLLRVFTGTSPGSNNKRSTRSTNHYNPDKRTHSSGSTTNPNSQSQYGEYQEIQQRAEDGWHTDLFEAEAGSVSDVNSRATSPLDLLDRADLEETLTLFRRVLDELD